jgi:predicted ArsR family transcriptional regulator
MTRRTSTDQNLGGSMIDAIADPVRARLARRLASRGPASLEELADAAGIHPNTARAHLNAMEGEGFVETSTEPSHGRGRPRTLFSLRQGWTLPDQGFLAMAELLAAALGATKPDPRALRRLGVRWGREIAAADPPDDARGELINVLTRLGFDAQIDGRRLILGGCPCPVISPDRPALVCKLVDAVVDGILDGSGSDLHAVRHEHDPVNRSCSALLQLEAA